MFGWLRGRRAREPVPIETALWEAATASWLFMRGLTPDENARLKSLSERFLGAKHFSGTHGLELNERMLVEIAAQACILVLELGFDWYEGWSEVIVYPTQFMPEREIVDDAGVVHVTRDPMAGEAWLGGPVILSYEDVALTADEEQRVAGYNVVIHEFAHKLDMLDGIADGKPPLHAGMDARAWRKAFDAAYEGFCDAVERAHDTWLDPYASEHPSEFFAVISEAFFENPAETRRRYPDVYEQLKLFYRQDPA